MATKAKQSRKQTTTAPTPTSTVSIETETQFREEVFEVFRRWGYLQATLDPLKQYLPAEPFPVDLPEGSDAIAAEARGYYCGNIALELAHIVSPERRQWLQEQMERPVAATKQQQAHTLSLLIKSDLFEQVIQQRYLGTKRFSLEGLTVLIPFLDQVFATASAAGVARSLIAMAHRGRLNVMANTIGRAPSEIFAKFEDVDPRSTR